MDINFSVVWNNDILIVSLALLLQGPSEVLCFEDNFNPLNVELNLIYYVSIVCTMYL
jgi:hypothetical protein